MTRLTMEWGRRHPKLNPLIVGLLDPSRGETKALLLLAMLLIGAIWLFLGVLEDIVSGDPLVRIDLGIYRLLQDLRTPWGDRIMVFITELGDSVVIGLVAATVLGWLLWLRNWRVAGYWTAAVVFGQVTASIMKLVIQRARPIADVYDGVSAYAFPSGHSVMSTVVYGFLAVLIARRIHPTRRWIAYGLAALLVSAIAMSRLYLGAHWLSDVIGGISFGLVWVSLLGIAYYRHSPQVALPGSVSRVALLALLLAGGWHVSERYSADLQLYAPRVDLQHREVSWWWQGGWQDLPAYRRDLEGEYEQPFNLQWNGQLAALRETLIARGWQAPVSLSPASALRWLLPAPAIGELPLLPQVHDGRHEALILSRPLVRNGSQQAGEYGNSRQLALRLWQSSIVLGPDSEPLWVGYVGSMTQREILLLRIPITLQEHDMSLDELMQDLDDFVLRTVYQTPWDANERPRWRGRTLLVSEN